MKLCHSLPRFSSLVVPKTIRGPLVGQESVVSDVPIVTRVVCEGSATGIPLISVQSILLYFVENFNHS